MSILGKILVGLFAIILLAAIVRGIKAAAESTDPEKTEIDVAFGGMFLGGALTLCILALIYL